MERNRCVHAAVIRRGILGLTANQARGGCRLSSASVCLYWMYKVVERSRKLCNVDGSDARGCTNSGSRGTRGGYTTPVVGTSSDNAGFYATDGIPGAIACRVREMTVEQGVAAEYLSVVNNTSDSRDTRHSGAPRAGCCQAGGRIWSERWGGQSKQARRFRCNSYKRS